MNCTDFMAKLTDYFDDRMEPELLEEVKAHLHTCHHCEVVVDTTRHTIEIYQQHVRYDFPEDLQHRLRAAVMERCHGVEKDEASSAAGTRKSRL